MEHKGRPGYEGRLTLMGAVGMAGGLAEATADCDRICVFRGSFKDVRVYTLGVPDLFRDGESIALEPGDRIYVGVTEWARFNMSLNQLLPFLSGMTSAISLGLSAAALREAYK